MPLSYIGFDGSGRQVRDLLHIDDLIELVNDQLEHPDHWNGVTANVGGGLDVSLSLRETTELCRELTGRELEIKSAGEDRPGDVAVYISDCARLNSLTDWRPQREARNILSDINDWIKANEAMIRATLIDS
jgi:CDP-paratose 2-epimerase